MPAPLAQALAAHLGALRQRAPASKARDEDSGSDRALVEARVYLNGAFFRMDHHPMEVCLCYAAACEEAASKGLLTSVWSGRACNVLGHINELVLGRRCR